MEYLEEKAKFSARWSVELMDAGFSIYKSIDEIINANEDLLLKTRNSPDNPTHQFLLIENKELNHIKSTYSYVKSQLDLITTDGEYPAKVQFNDESSPPNKTKWMSLNRESAKVITGFLKERFNL